MKQIGVGLLGFGTVGAGVVKGLQERRELLAQKIGADIVLRRIADLDIKSDRGVTVDPAILTTEASEVINDPAVDVVVELIGGTGIAKTLVMEALRAGKSVVTANKKLLAEYGEEIFTLAEESEVDIYFGASVGGGIPIVRVLREGLVGNAIVSMYGILNGTCNYILTRMENEGLPFDDVLKEAQAAGYAESNPSLDIDGFDTAHKAVILASLAYGFHVPMSVAAVEGIRGLAGIDVKFASELGFKIKLLAIIRGEGDEVEVRVSPTLVAVDHVLASVSGVFNAVMVKGDYTGDTLYYGRGAGRKPTASTVIGDICDIARNMIAGGPRHSRGIVRLPSEPPRMRSVSESRSRYYLRLMVLDRAGSLGRFTTILGSHGVSIQAVSQKCGAEVTDSDYQPVVALTHVAREADIEAALAEIRASGVIGGEPVKIRILD
ncbi:MAG: homoserine dehydrogenase [Lentisphaerae bacterium]|nr:homoserine dehydrogenase [Lentisphaerota bacterium]